MRKIFLSTALVAGVAAAGALLPSSAGAMTISTPAAVQDAVKGSGLTEEVRYVCRRVWTGFGWRRSCFWRPNYGYYGPRHRHRGYRYGYRYY